MKNQKREGSGGLQDWLSYQSRTRTVAVPEHDVIDWDDGIQVQEEWLPREQCEQRLREEAGRCERGTATAAAENTTVIEVAEIDLQAGVDLAPVISSAAPREIAAAIASPKGVDSRESAPRESNVRELRPKQAMPTQIESQDFAGAVPAYKA